MFKKDTVERHLENGLHHLQEGEILKAKDSYIHALTIDPDNITALNNLSQIHAMLNEREKAKGYGEILLDECNRRLQGEKSERLLILKANALVALERPDEANDVFDEILKINPKHTLSLFQKASYMEIKDEPEESLKLIEEILKSESHNVQALLLRGRLMTKLNRFDEAEEMFDTVFRIDPKNKTAMNLKSKLIKEKNSTTIAPHDFMLKGLEAWEREELKASLNYFDKALSLDDGYGEIWYIRGELLIRMGQISNAIISFKKAFEIDPNSGGIVKKKEFFRLLNAMKRVNAILGLE